MKKVKKAYRKVRPALLFVGRHFFTIATLILMICWVNIKTAQWDNIAISLLLMMLFDWWKMKLKWNGGGPVRHYDSVSHDTPRDFLNDNAGNASIIGTAAWHANSSNRQHYGY